MFARIVQLILGHIILSLGVVITILADIGTAPWETVTVGLNLRFGLTVGTWVFIVHVILVGLNALIVWEKPKVQSLIGSILTSIGVDLWMLVFESIPTPSIFGMQVLFFISGVCTIALGIAIYMRTELLFGPVDGLMVAVSKRFRISNGLARGINELIALIVGYLLGGSIGLGTVIVVVSIGYTLQSFSKLLDKLKSKGFPMV